ncbi:Uncharacterised protein [Serratia grimesii]|uniref:endonuclease NucS domain-containing protein n=1 Tax=Serratia grimesii TaxID=82995 RepID=UPI00217798BD|nr:endonuclease NucS domain-containing protein [Serratia grimesii]CAI1686267.1 Uncharacterised protein [Serratia grimesii]
MNRIEDVIRDKLAEKLCLFENDLSLISMEKYLKNPKGTKGFVDLLAKDNLNRFVLIELKRSNAASREALHEVIKYFEGIKEEKSLKDDEIMVYIVSTEWKELLVPFSRFVNDVSFNVEGYLLEIDDENNPIHLKKIEPIKINNNRRLSSQCKVCFYTSSKNRDSGIKSFESAFMEKEISDYVLVLLSNHNQNVTNGFDYMIYASVQEMEVEEYIYILSKDKELYDEYEDIINERDILPDDEYINMLHGFAVDDCEPHIYFDYLAIGYPSKFNHSILGDEGWSIEEVIKYGKFKNNELLTDDVIINELKGDAGENKTRYIRDMVSKNKASFEVVKNEIKQCLVDNKIWQKGVLHALDEIYIDSELLSLQVMIYNPMNILRSLHHVYADFWALPSDQGLRNAHQWIPEYKLLSEGEGKKHMYVGMLKDNKRRLNLENYFARFYNGKENLYFHSFLSGGYNHSDVNESKAVGLEYANYKISHDNIKNLTEYFFFTGFEYEKIDPLKLNDDIIKFVLSEAAFMDDLNCLFKRRLFSNGMVDLSDHE